ncbi:MAG: DUF4126 family protein [Candidatus Sulfotelmatobacter sp.]
MNSGFALWFAFGIGLVAGMRSFTAPAIVAWSAHLHWISLQVSPVAFMASKWTVIVFSVLAVIELVMDQLPSTPPRTSAVGLSARIVTGALAGACIAVASFSTLWAGALCGAIGAMVGAFGGYNVRVGLVRILRVPDFVIAIPEDLLAIGLGLFFGSR